MIFRRSAAKFRRLALLAEEPFLSVFPKAGRYSIVVDRVHHLRALLAEPIPASGPKSFSNIALQSESGSAL